VLVVLELIAIFVIQSLPAIVVATAALAAGAVAFGVVRRRASIPARLGDSVAPLVAVLREDMAPEAPLTLRLDLRGGEINAKRVDQRKLDRPPGKGAPSTTEATYADPWLGGAAELADGSRLEWTVTDELRKREVSRRNPRGKLKTKAKYKVKRQIDVRLAFPDDYAALAAGERRQGQERLAVRPGEKRTVVKLRRVFVRYHRDAPLEARSMLDLMADAYREVTPARVGGR
jgi:hypothetical protein